jgi:hypothetical protein
MQKTILTIAMLAAGAISVSAQAQTKADFDELRAEIQKLRQELNAIKVQPSTSANASVIERLEQVEIKQKDAVVVGDIAGSYRIPGSETSLRLYGFAELNLVREGQASNADNDYSTFVPYAPINGTSSRTGQTYLHARTSRLGVEASTPTEYGPLGIKIEGDFNNEPRTGNGAVYGDKKNLYTQQATNSYGYRVRHAYGTFGGLTIGQTWSTFMDVDNSPETVDFNGPIGSTFVRQPQIRYSYNTKESGSFAVALENPVSYVLDSTGAPMTSGFSKLPDLIGRWDKSFDWGAMSVRGLVHQLALNDGAGNKVSALGKGIASTAFIKTRDAQDFASVALTYGRGIGRYFNYVEGAAYDAGTNKIQLENAVGIVLGYQYKHSPTLRVNGALGYQRNFDNGYTDLIKANGLDSGQYGINRSAYQAHIGLIYNPIKNVDFGLEYIKGQRKTLAGEKGDLSRFNLSAKYNFN